MAALTPLHDPDDGRLTRSNEGTLHHQLYHTLSEMIRSGAVKPGERLPTEAELVEAYGVSRTTARRALDELRREGVVERQPGKGTFLRQPRLNAAIPHLHSITDEIEHLGYKPGTVPLSVEQGRADQTVAQQLAIEVGDPVLVVKRIRTADDQPVYVATSTLNITRFPELANTKFTEGMYPQFESLTGRRMSRGVQWLSAVPASSAVARSLQTRSGAPVLRLELIVYFEGDLPVETVDGYFHGRRYKHYSQMHRQAD